MTIDDKLREFARQTFVERVTYLYLPLEKDASPQNDRSTEGIGSPAAGAPKKSSSKKKYSRRGGNS
jgi:hypothetical protein